MNTYEWLYQNYWDFNIMVWGLFTMFLIHGLLIAETKKFRLYVTLTCIGSAAAITIFYTLGLLFQKLLQNVHS